MALTPAVIEDRTENVLANKIGLVSYDENALGHDVYRRTNASMEGDPETNGERVGVQINPTEDFVDANIETGNTYYYAIISRTQLDPIGSFFKTLRDNNMMHIYDNAELMILPDSEQHQEVGLANDYKHIDKIVSLDPLKREWEGTYYVKDSYFRLGSSENLASSLQLPPISLDLADSFYVRFWHYFDYDTTEFTSPNLNVLSDTNFDFILRWDGNRPRPDVEFSDGKYNPSPSVYAGGKRLDPFQWQLFEVIWDASIWRYEARKHINGVFTDTQLAASTRTEGATLDISTTPRFIMSASGASDRERNIGSVYMSRAIPSVAEREIWFNDEKQRYGYV